MKYKALLGAGLMAAGMLLGGAGCSNKATTSTAGGGKFTVKVPDATLKQGEETKFEVKLTRESGFKDEVALKFENLPEGVSVKESPAKFKEGDSDVTFHLVAKDDAKVQDNHEAKVVASGGGSDTPPVTFKVSVKPK